MIRQLLVINPNTSAAVSALLQRHVQSAAGPGVLVRTATARLGAPYIACEASNAVAAHAALDAWAAALADGSPAPDAVLIGCFGDPGLWALKEASPVPVRGLAEAAFIEAAAIGRFAIVTGGARWPAMLQRLALALGHGDSLRGVHTVAPTGAQLAQDPAAARALLAAACCEAAAQWDVQALILGGAGLAGLAAQIQHQVPLPLIDSVLAGARQALVAMEQPLTTPGSGRFELRWQGVSGEMVALGLAPASRP